MLHDDTVAFLNAYLAFAFALSLAYLTWELIKDDK